MKKNTPIYIQDIIESIEKIDLYKEGIIKNDFFENTQVQDAIIRRLKLLEKL